MSFLHKVSDYIFTSFGDKTEELCIVLPNRRAGLFLKKHLAERAGKPLWSPQIFSIEDFIWELSGLKQADQAEQLFVFYSVYKEAEGEKADTFDNYCRWAPTLLNDFNETDSYLADTEKLFGNLGDIRAIENWSLGGPGLTDFQKQYIHFWSSIGGWYRLYKERLLKENLAYPGLAYRLVAETIGQRVADRKWHKIIFAGFNALSTAEEKIFSVLRENGKADLLWDTDRYYLEDTANEAGRFLRQYRGKYFRPLPGAPTHFSHTEDLLSTESKTVTVAGVARMVSQAKAAAHFLGTLNPATRYSTDTAIVLCDEMLLLPLLHALPEDAQNINITMGFPLRATPVASLVMALFRLHINARRFNIVTREGELKYYHADLTRLVRHPYIRQLFSSSALAERIDEYLAQRNIIFCSAGHIARELTMDDETREKLGALLTPWENAGEALDGIAKLGAMLRPVFAVKTKTNEDEPAPFNIEVEYLFQLHLILKRARTLHDKWQITGELSSLRALIEQQLASSSLPFYGEPLAGLQVMGLLETRTLDFENVVLLSANENILPGGKTQHTFIVFDLRKHFGLPVWDDKDAVSAYHFYRLLQRAKNVFIVHNTDQDTFGNREKSRFVTQLLHELPVKNKNARIEEIVFDAGFPEAPGTAAPIIVPKSERVREKLDALAAKGLSPSLLNSYRSCTLQFYFHYVAGLREPDEVEELIGADTLGTIIHKTLEELYKPAIGQPLAASFFDEARKKAPHVCEAMFAKIYSTEESSYGKNLLAKKVATRYVTSYLDAEKKKLASQPGAPVPTVAALETDLKFSVSVAGKTIVLSGQADRIDTTDRAVTLIDYKTGKAERKELRIQEWIEISDNPVIGKSFQLLMYAWLYSRMTGNTLPVSSGIVSFRKLNDGFLNVSTPDGDFILPQTLLRFEEALLELLESLFDEEKDFVQTEDLTICRICAFNAVCRRN